jgi:chromosome segregation ATPase
MSIDGLPEQFEEFVERARAALGREITAAKTVVAAAMLKKVQCRTRSRISKRNQDQLAAVTNDLHRAAGLVGVGHNIEQARAELQRVKRETEQASKALERLSKERTEREAQVNALGAKFEDWSQYEPKARPRWPISEHNWVQCR